MQLASFVLACLACVGYSFKDPKILKLGISSPHGDIEDMHPLKSLTKLLVVLKPRIGWQSRFLSARMDRFAKSTAIRSSALMNAHWMDFLKFDGAKPQFDVLEQTKMVASFKRQDQIAPYLADDYIFRGSIVGPITMKDISDTQGKLDIQAAFSDLDRGTFGFTVDPQNPFRCFFFERWTATHSGEMVIDGLPEFIGRFPPTGKKIELPIHINSIIWNPEGKIIYQSISPPIDRFEGNTKGIGANYGLLVAAGVTSGKNEHVGNPFLMLQQKVFQAFGGTFWSDDEKIPDWWKSKAKGADPTDL